MSYNQTAGPSTPGRGLPSYGRPSESIQTQQRSSSGSGIGNDSSFSRTSALRNTPGPQPSQSSFGFGGMREMSTPKQVRWEDAPSSPITNQPISNSAQQQQQQPPSQRYPFTLQYVGGQYPQQQQQQQQYQGSQQQPQHQQAQVQKFQPWTSSAATPLAQRTSPNSSFNRSFSSSFSTPGPNQSQVSSTASPATAPGTRSIFNNVSTAVASRPAAVAKPPPAAPKAQQNIAVASGSTAVKTSYPAIVSRIKWNSLALILLWLVPRSAPVSRSYWLALDAAFIIFGGDADVYMASTFSWLHRASLLVLCINIAEAMIMLNTASSSAPALVSAAATTKRKPSLAFPPNRVVSASAPASSSPLVNSKINTPHHYAQGSPLRESIFRASATAQGLGEGRRFPTQTPRHSSGMRQPSNATPLAAFLARKHEQRMVSGGDTGDVSWTSGDAGADLSTDTIEVDRALRAFSAGYEREMSQSAIAV